MPFRKEICIGQNKVLIYINDEPCFKHKEKLIFGSPLGINSLDLNMNDDLDTYTNNLKGHWLILRITDQSFSVTNDLFGGYRLYYRRINNDYYFSDDFYFLFKIKEGINTYCGPEYNYWLKHRFTIGDSTFVKEIKKLPPSSSFLLENDNSEFVVNHFKSVSRNLSASKFQEAVHSDLKNSFEQIKGLDKPVLLMFSGGKDSHLLAKFLLESKIPFKAIYFYFERNQEFEKKNIGRIIQQCKRLNFDFEIIKISDVQVDEFLKHEMDIVINEMLFDRHFMALHMIGMKMLGRLYPKDSIIINGQSSDSIFSFGPSEKSIMSFFRRNMMYRPFSLISKIGVLLLNLKSQKAAYRLPQNDKDSLIALLDEYKYCRVIDKNNGEEYKNYLEDKVLKYTNDISSFESKEMYVKILSFLQGSDNQVVLKSCKLAGFNKIFMPFATPQICYSTIEFKNNIVEIYRPKYILNEVLKNFPENNVWFFKNWNISLSFSRRKTLKYNEIIQNQFFQRAKSLIAQMNEN